MSRLTLTRRSTGKHFSDAFIKLLNVILGSSREDFEFFLHQRAGLVVTVYGTSVDPDSRYSERVNVASPPASASLEAFLV